MSENEALGRIDCALYDTNTRLQQLDNTLQEIAKMTGVIAEILTVVKQPDDSGIKLRCRLRLSLPAQNAIVAK